MKNTDLSGLRPFVLLLPALALAGCVTARAPERELLQRERLETVSAELGKTTPELNERSDLNDFLK